MIIYIIFVHTSLYVMVLQVGKICVLDSPRYAYGKKFFVKHWNRCGFYNAI